MPEQNPYQPPAGNNPFAEDVVDAVVAAQPGGLWRQGRTLVMHKQAALPDRCVKSNEPAGGYRLRRQLSWHHPAIFLSVLIGLLIYVVLAVVLSKRATIHIGLSERWRRKRRRRILVGWMLALAGFILLALGLFWMDQNENFGYVAVAGPFVFLFGLFYGLFTARMVAPRRITDD